MNTNPEEYHYKLERWAKALLIAAIVLVGFAFSAPYIFTRSSISASLDFSKTGGIADTVGGLMNPFVALAGVIVTGLAFYMQYKANIIQRQLSQQAIEESRSQLKEQLAIQKAQYDVQQFETHFLEMLRLHKENVNEMKLTSQDGHEYGGRIVFRRAVEEFHNIINHTQFSYTPEDGQQPPTDTEVFPSKFRNAYEIFFWGKSMTRRYQIDNEKSVSFATTPTLLSSPQRDWHGILGHYYRHLYHIVRYVVESPIIIVYEDKMRYLKILRAQLSNYEQIMLFYNWLADYGKDWEFEKENSANEYFTRYRMIHNVWSWEVYQHSFVGAALERLDIKSRRILGKPLLEENE